jgi:hypothetical protein
MNAPLVRLNNGLSIPQVGLGTWPLTDAEVAPLIVTAVEAGYRHLDTAVKYDNEAGVGQGIRDSGIAREELFVTTKLDGTYQGSDLAIGGLEGSLTRLGLDYVDLLLIHWPVPQRDLYVSTWQTFERLLADGRARSIGVSNFKPAHLDRLLAETDVVPAVNQIQLNPYVTRAAQGRATSSSPNRCWPASPRSMARRPARSCCAGTSNSAWSSSPSRPPPSGSARTSTCSISPSTRPTSTRSPRSTRGRMPASIRTWSATDPRRASPGAGG